MTDITPGQVSEIPLGKLRPDPKQPRHNFDAKRLRILADSLKTGVQVPILVRRKGKTLFTIQDGERRYRAAKLAKLKSLPALLLEDKAKTDDIRVAQLAVNNMREKLSTMEVARTLADLQSSQFKSMNELQAHLEANGMPAMKPKEIRDLIDLVKLPKWAQDYVESGVFQLKAALRLKLALERPEVMLEVEKSLADHVGWSGRISESNVINSMRFAASEVGHDLTRTEYWHENPVHFDHKNVCKGCEHLLRFDRYAFCMSAEGFEKNQKAAIEAGLGPGGVKQQKSQAATHEGSAPPDKAAKREEQLRRFTERYFHTYLIARIERFMRPGDVHINISDELLAWACMGKPGEAYGERAQVPSYSSSEATSTTCLEKFFAAKDVEELKREAAIGVLRELRFREVLAICHELWGPSVEKVYRLDAGYLQLLRKPELLEFVEQFSLEGKFKTKKVADIRSGILEAVLKAEDGVVPRRIVPTMIRELYGEVPAPFEPYHTPPLPEEPAGKPTNEDQS